MKEWYSVEVGPRTSNGGVKKLTMDSPEKPVVERDLSVRGGDRPCNLPIDETVAPVSTRNRTDSPATNNTK